MSFDSFLFVLKRAVSNIFRNVVLSLASVSILVACLVIFGITLMLSENVSYFIDNLGEAKPELWSIWTKILPMSR